jgi:hypothetical protein
VLRGAAALTAAVAAAALGLALDGPPGARAATTTGCQATPSACGYPDATNTGVPAGTTLTSVPAQATTGPGWSYNTTTQTLNVTTSGTVLSGLNIADWRVGINATSGKITGNYIHDPGFLAGDHTDGIYDYEGNTPLAITGNTIENSLGQACDIILETAPAPPSAP